MEKEMEKYYIQSDNIYIKKQLYVFPICMWQKI